MPAVPNNNAFIDTEEYLKQEELSPFRNEYIEGVIFAMAGGSTAHNRILHNLIREVDVALESEPCELFFQVIKVRLRIASQTSFYYPDLMIACDPADNHPLYRERPAVIFEILSPSTERIDKQEKLLAYQTIPSLQDYILVDQEKLCVTHHRFSEQTSETLRDPDEELCLSRFGFKMPLRKIYHRTALLT